MPLLLHELVIGSGSTTVTASPVVQKCPPHHVAIATVSHPGSATQVTQLQQNKIVAISSNHARLNSDNSRLAEALAGNSPYSYPANSAMHITPAIQVSYATPTYNVHATSSSSKSTATYSSVQSSQRYSKGMSKHSYQLPFVLQDHNYGAPPPQTPPHSPTSIPHVTVSSLSTSYKVQNVNSNVNSSPKKLLAQVRGGNDVRKPVAAGKQPKGRADAANIPISLNMHNNGNKIVGPIANSIPTQYIASLPLHRQQFMPQPKPPVFPSPLNLTPTKGENSLQPLTGTDTDEESRLSDRGSSVGTSGEETETAPEGEGEDLLQLDDSITRCVCDMTHDDGYMIQCDRCYVWQHVDCMEIDRNDIPEEYLCEACSPRRIDKIKAKTLQMRRMQEIKINLARVSSSDSDDNGPVNCKIRPMSNKSMDRKVLKKKKPKVIKEVKIVKKIMPTRKNSLPTGPSNGTLANNVQSTSPTESKDIKICKTRRRHSVTPVNEGTDENVSHVSKEQIQSWLHNYEAAVTNHYSPELRAKIQCIRINGISPEFLESANGASSENRCKIYVPSYNSNYKYYESKILVATVDTNSGSAIAEYQGKYMLLSQWSPVQLPNGVPYIPYVVQYNMVKEGVAMCIDARTYGNNARFARKGSKYNAKIRHIIKRGSVHLYLVACEDIKEGQEIVLALESAVSLNPNFKGNKRLSTSSNSQSEPVTSVDETLNSSTDETPVLSPRKNGSFQNKKLVKKSNIIVPLPQPIRQTRRTTSCEVFEELLPIAPISPPIAPISPPKLRRSSGSKSPSKAPVNKSPFKVTRSTSSEVELLKENILALSPTLEPNNVINLDKKDDQKMTREERKIAAIMKAFERMEKAHQRRKDNEKKKGGDKKDDTTDPNSSIEEEDRYSTDDTSRSNEGHKRKKRSNSSNSQRSIECDDSSDLMKSSPDSAPSAINGPFRFPKTKKALMTEWLNETVDGPVLPTNSVSGLETSGVKPCYMRSPSVPVRRPSGPGSATNNAVEMAGRSAKKRWLRQAIIDESEPIPSPLAHCSSPNSRPESPNGNGDYTTPLKKRRVARESMSSEHSNTPPTTPQHTSIDDDKLNIDHDMDLCLNSEYTDENDEKPDINEIDEKPDVKKLEKDISDNKFDQITVNIGALANEIDSKVNVKKEIKPDFHKVDVKKQKKKTETPNSVLCKPSFKPKLKKCKSKKKSKILTSSVTNRTKTKCAKRTKKNNAERKCKNNKGKDKKSTLCLDSDLDVASVISHPPASKDVLEVKKLIQEESTQELQGNSPNVDLNNSEDSIMPEKDITLATEEKQESTKPIPIKRKLSISEYRKRKSVSTDIEPVFQDDVSVQKNESVDILSPHFKFDLPTLPHLKEYVTFDDNKEMEISVRENALDSSVQDVQSPFSDDLTPSSSPPSIAIDNFLSEVGCRDDDVKWNAAPTLLEQQRENLTARLRREFGLCIPDDKSKRSSADILGKVNQILGSTEVDSGSRSNESNLHGRMELNLSSLNNVSSSLEERQLEPLSHPRCDKL